MNVSVPKEKTRRMVNLQKLTRRENHRFDQPQFQIFIDDFQGHSKDWSLGGIAVLPDEGEGASFAVDSEVSGQIAASEDSEKFDFSGRVVRVESERGLMALRFSDLSQDTIMMFVQSFRQMIGGVT